MKGFRPWLLVVGGLVLAIWLLVVFAPAPVAPPDKATRTNPTRSAPPAIEDVRAPAAPAPLPPSVPDSPPASSAKTDPPSNVTPPADADAEPVVENPPAVEPPGTVAEALDEVQRSLRDYRAVMGANPVGTNAEITQALMGDNLKQVRIGVPAGSALNGEGELTDRWGTPYFFHQLSGTQMEVRSAGPDRTMWTADDTQM